MKVKAAVLIPTYNRGEILNISLKSIDKSKHHELFDVYVIDNGSTDNTLEICKAHKICKYVKLKKNYYIAKALNYAFINQKLIQKYKYITVIANDVVVNRFTFFELIQLMESDSRIGVGGPLHFEIQNNTLRSCGVNINKTTSLLSNYLDYKKPNTINHFHSCFIIRADVFKKICGFNYILFPMIYEEPDLGERILALKYKIQVTEKAKIWHPIDLSVQKKTQNYLREKRMYSSLAKSYLFFRNRIIYMSLYAGKIRFIIFYVIFNPLIFLYYIRNIKQEYFKYALTGTIDGTVFALTKNLRYIKEKNHRILGL